ncbi:MAG: efflux RND transporter periplasmic adaptor subunit [Methylococcaceae bacterium]|nr:efflux RND transporter periplasmic adaptor subunit [Methylococcaceae bacterium]
MNKQMLQQRKNLFLIGLLAIVLSAACSESSDHKQTAQQIKKPQGEVYLAPGSPKKAYVKTASLTPVQHPLLEPLAGKIIYNESMTSRVSSPVAGRVIAAPLALGTQVQVGSTLLELDSPDVADAEADFAKAQADLTLASHAFNRQQELYAGKAVSLKELEQAQDAFNNARSEVHRAQDRLKNLHISTRQSDGRFALRSTVSGTVVERNVNPGMEVRPDRDTPLFVVSDIKKLTLLMQVFEVNLGKVRLGQRLSVWVPAYPGETFPATVQYIGQVLDEQTRTVQVRCELPNPDGRLLPGMYATITVESDPDDKAIVIPLTAVFTEGDSDYVFVALDEDHFQQRPVDINLRLKDQAVVSSGLAAGDQLVTEGALMLRAEEEIDIENSKP